MNWKAVKKAISLDVYRWSLGDCTNGGVTSKATRIFLLTPEGNLDVADLDPELVFYPENRGGNYWAARPLHEKGWSMFGGNLAHSSDGRCPAPLHVHDRYETPEQSEILSR